MALIDNYFDKTADAKTYRYLRNKPEGQSGLAYVV